MTQMTQMYKDEKPQFSNLCHLRHLWICLLVVLVFCASSAHCDSVERRGGEATIEGAISKFDDAGVTIKDTFVPWDHVRNIVMDRPDPALESHLEIAANLWRARARLERNDTALAEPLFERLFEQYRGKSNDMALLVAEGLLRCRLARGANDAAVIPALEAARLRNKKLTLTAFPNPVLDEQTSLCKSLPPVWVNSSSLVKLERDLNTYDAQGDTVVAALASLYQRAIRQQMGMAVDENSKPLAADHPGVKLLRSVVETGAKDSQKRNTAREGLLKDLPSLPDWAQAWAHYLIGLSLLSETGMGRQQAGMVHLAHLPAQFAGDQPYLTGMALARLAFECDRTGETAAAATLRAELASRFPNHPIQSALARASTSNRPSPTSSTKPSQTRPSKESS